MIIFHLLKFEGSAHSWLVTLHTWCTSDIKKAFIYILYFQSIANFILCKIVINPLNAENYV